MKKDAHSFILIKLFVLWEFNLIFTFVLASFFKFDVIKISFLFYVILVVFLYLILKLV